MAADCDAVETRALALVGMSLSYALGGVLKRMAVLDQQATEDAFEAALSGLENSFLADDRAAAMARQLLDLMGAQLATLKPEPDRRKAARSFVRVALDSSYRSETR